LSVAGKSGAEEPLGPLQSLSHRRTYQGESRHTGDAQQIGGGSPTGEEKCTGKKAHGHRQPARRRQQAAPERLDGSISFTWFRRVDKQYGVDDNQAVALCPRAAALTQHA
jgi:hypothetical protein